MPYLKGGMMSITRIIVVMVPETGPGRTGWGIFDTSGISVPGVVI
jgi:hypothetical protein